MVELDGFANFLGLEFVLVLLFFNRKKRNRFGTDHESAETAIL
jgi:hypothetical protein